MEDSYRADAYAINHIFESQFSNIYKESNPKYRARLLPYISSIYRRWYFSTLYEDSLLSPANLFESLNRAHNQPPDTMPVVNLRSQNRYTGMHFTFQDYAQKHPVLDDFRLFVELCLPDIELNEDDGLPDAQITAIMNKLSIWDPHYVSYLLGVSIGMGLIVKIPSIYANRAQVVQDYEKRLSVENDELFTEIVNTTIRMASYSLSELIPLPQAVFDERFIRTLLKTPMETDEIFERVYSILGLSLEDLLDPEDEDEFDGLNMAVISGTFLLGVILDKFFFTPFGFYLKLIRPLYVLPFDFESEIKYFLESGFDEEELYTAFFAPCSRYYFTDLGLKYFKLRPNVDNHINVTLHMPFARTWARITGEKKAPVSKPARLSQVESLLFPQDAIYALKIKSENNPDLWMHLEMPADETLHHLFLETAVRFFLNPGSDYSFFRDRSENPFSEYVSPKHPKRAKKTADIALLALDLQQKQEFVMTVYPQSGALAATRRDQPPIRIAFTLMDMKHKQPSRSYPNATRMSRELRALTTDNIDNDW